MTKPLPCPFCKTSSGLNVQEVDRGVYAVCCAICNAIGPHFSPVENAIGTDREHAINCWNTAQRPTEVAMPYSTEVIVLP